MVLASQLPRSKQRGAPSLVFYIAYRAHSTMILFLNGYPIILGGKKERYSGLSMEFVMQLLPCLLC